MKYTLATLGLLVVASVPVDAAVVHIEHGGQVRTLFWMADGETLATGGADGVVRLSAVDTGKEIRKFDLGGPIYGLAVSNDGKWLGVRQEITDGKTPPASVIDVKTGNRTRQLSPVYDRYYTPHLAFSTDGNVLIGAGPASRMHFPHARGGASASGSKNRDGYFGAVAPNGASYALGRTSGIIQRYEASGRSSQGLRVGPCTGMVFSPDGKILAIAQTDHDIALWDVAANKLIGKLKGASNPLSLLSYSGDGKMLGAYDKANRKFWLWDVASKQVRRRITLPQTSLQTLALSKDGRKLATATGNHALVWNIARRELGKLEPINLSNEQLDNLWADLANSDFAKTDAAFRKLAAGQSTAVPFLKSKIRKIAVPKIDESRLNKLLKNLDSDRYRLREQAQVELAKYGELVIPHLEKLLETSKSLEARARAEKILSKQKEGDLTPDRLRVLESFELFETLGTPAARSVLEEIARDALVPTIRRAAQAALDRTQTQ